MEPTLKAHPAVNSMTTAVAVLVASVEAAAVAVVAVASAVAVAATEAAVVATATVATELAAMVEVTNSRVDSVDIKQSHALISH